MLTMQLMEITMARVSHERPNPKKPAVSGGRAAAEREAPTRAVSENVLLSSSVRPGAPDRGSADEARRQLIAEAAYRLAERRGFAPGLEVEDWLAAEREVDERMGGGAIG